MKTTPIFPEQASNFAQEMDLLYAVLVGLSVLFGLLVFVPLLYFVIKYRVGTKADRSNPPHHNLKLELAWSIIPLAMGLPVFVWAANLFVRMYTPIKVEDSLEITVIGKQWMWHLQHPTGQRENNELHIPVGRQIKLTMISQDVIHSFYVPAFRIKKDVLPARYSTQWFTATKPGKYHLLCAEYCGTDHSKMGGYVYVLRPDEYEQWLKSTTWGMASTETMEQAGQRLFNDLGCVACHGPGAERPIPLDGIYGMERVLRDGRRVIADEEYIRMSIFQPDAMVVAGYEPSMMSFKGLIDEQEILQLIAYIKSLGTKTNELEGTKP